MSSSCAIQTKGITVKTPSAFFMARRGKVLTHTQNLLNQASTLGKRAKCMFLRNYTLCEVDNRQTALFLAAFCPKQSVAQMCPVFGMQKRARQEQQRRMARCVRRGRLIDGTVSRLATASGFCWPISPEVPLQGHPCKTQPVGLNSADGFRRHLAPSWKRFLVVASGLSNTCPFIPVLSVLDNESDSLQTRTRQGVEAVLARLETYCAKFSNGQGVKTGLSGGAA